MRCLSSLSKLCSRLSVIALLMVSTHAYSVEPGADLVNMVVQLTMSDNSVITMNPGSLAGYDVYQTADSGQITFGLQQNGLNKTGVDDFRSDLWKLYNNDPTGPDIVSVTITLPTSVFTDSNASGTSYDFIDGSDPSPEPSSVTNVETLDFSGGDGYLVLGPDGNNNYAVWQNDTVPAEVQAPEPATYMIMASFLGAIAFFHSRKMVVS